MTDREKFEAWYLDHWKNAGGWAAGHTLEDIVAMRGDDGEYIGGYITGCWHGFQAALASQQPADDGWIEWDGGECPVGPNAVVEVKLRSGSGYQGWQAKTFDWPHLGMPLDIIAYRVVKP